MDELLVIWIHFSRWLARTHDTRTLYAVDAKGGGRSSAIIRKMSTKRFRGMATSAIWKATQRLWLTTFAPILISLSLSVGSDRSWIGSGINDYRMAVKIVE
jgi:hypothetical protein